MNKTQILNLIEERISYWKNITDKSVNALHPEVEAKFEAIIAELNLILANIKNIERIESLRIK